MLKIMTHEELLKICLSYKGAYEDYPFGEDVICLKVKGRIFAQLFYLKGEPMLTFNAEPMTGEFYRSLYPDDIKRGYHCPPVQQPYFNTVRLCGGVPDDEFPKMISVSYNYVKGKLTKRLRTELDTE